MELSVFHSRFGFFALVKLTLRGPAPDATERARVPADADSAAFDTRIRAYVFNDLMRTGTVPSFEAIAGDFEREPNEIRESFRRLAEAHVFVLQDTGELMAANPFAAIPTPFQIIANGVRYSAMCIWDSLGIPAMLKTDADIHTTCGDCYGEIVVRIADGELQRGEGVVHFAVPAAQWWNNIVYS